MNLIIRTFYALSFTMLLLHAPAWAKKADEANGSTGLRPAFLVDLRGGFLVTAADAELRDRWDHDTFYSYAFGTGLHYVFPRSWKEFYFFGGGDFNYLTSEEELSSNLSNSYLTTSLMELLATIGFAWEPDFLGGAFGTEVGLGVQLWSERKTEFETSNYSRNLGSEETQAPLVPSLGFHYRFFGEWTATLKYDWRTRLGLVTDKSSGSTVWLGGRYGF